MAPKAAPKAAAPKGKKATPIRKKGKKEAVVPIDILSISKLLGRSLKEDKKDKAPPKEKAAKCAPPTDDDDDDEH